MNKRGLHCAILRAVFSLILFFPTSILLSFSPPYIFQAPCPFLLLILVPLQVSNALLSFPYLSLSSLSSTPLHYEDQLRIAPRKCMFILLDSLILKNLHYNLLIHLFKACFTPHENMHWVPSEFCFFFVALT